MSLFAQLEVYHDLTSRSAAMNMAIDEALLQLANVPSIRFYRWDHPALSFGYFGKFSDVSDHAAERDLVRRWTGGGIVFHGDDLTYSIVIPARDPLFAESSMSIYEKIHRVIRNVLVSMGQRAELTSEAATQRAGKPLGELHSPMGIRVSASGERESISNRNQINSAVTDRRYNENTCFTSPVPADVMINGRKVAGAAHRRTRAGLLHQGSIQQVDFSNGLTQRFAGELSATHVEKVFDGSLIEHAGRIAQQKYGSTAWLHRR